jgi:hypothetical protein
MGVDSHLTSQIRGACDQMPREEFHLISWLGAGWTSSPSITTPGLACRSPICEGRLGPMPCTVKREFLGGSTAVPTEDPISAVERPLNCLMRAGHVDLE